MLTFWLIFARILFVGLIWGMRLLIIGAIFYPKLPQEFIELGEKIKLTPIARLCYGGITEEILLRFGLMTLVIWVLSNYFNLMRYYLLE